MIWPRKLILIVAGLILLAFGLGVVVGARFGQPPVVYREVSVPQTSSPKASSEPDPEPAAGNPSGCVDIHSASGLEGRNGCVSGPVLRVYTAASGNTFLDFCQDYRTCPFTSVIFAADKAHFGDVGTLQGRRIEISGNVVAYQGRAEIILHDPKQVRSAP
jgi:hypothetical protein